MVPLFRDTSGMLHKRLNCSFGFDTYDWTSIDIESLREKPRGTLCCPYCLWLEEAREALFAEGQHRRVVFSSFPRGGWDRGTVSMMQGELEVYLGEFHELQRGVWVGSVPKANLGEIRKLFTRVLVVPDDFTEREAETAWVLYKDGIRTYEDVVALARILA